MWYYMDNGFLVNSWINTEVEKELLRSLIDNNKWEDFDENELVTENWKEFLRLLKKYHWNEAEVMGNIQGTVLEDYGVEVISRFGKGTDMKFLLQDMREEKRKYQIEEIKKQALIETDMWKLKELLSNIPEFPEIEEEWDMDEVIEEVVMWIMWEWKPIKKISTGFDKLDKYLDWWFYPGTLNIVAWRPWTWKSAFSLAMFNNQTLWDNLSGAYFSLEMWRKEVLQRIFSNQTGIDFSKIRSGKGVEDLSSVNTVLEILKDSKIQIIDNLFKFSNICAKIKELSKSWLDIAYIDYLGLMEIKADSKYQEISKMTRALKELSRECNIPIILLSQLNRNDSNRWDKTPQLSDLRDSGSIEQDADSVIMLYKPDEDTQEIDLWLRKNRNWPSDIMIEYESQYRCMRIGEK